MLHLFLQTNNAFAFRGQGVPKGVAYLLSSPLFSSIYPLLMSMEIALDQETTPSIDNRLGNETHESGLVLSVRAVDVFVEVLGNQLTKGPVSFVLETKSSSAAQNVKICWNNR